MPRAKTVFQSEFPYSVSARCINKEWFQLPMDVVWEIFCSELSEAVRKHGVIVHSFVLMSNHFHLIVSTPNANISQSMHQFMGKTSRRITKAGNRINQTYSGRHYKCILHDMSYYLNTYKYIYRNPVAAGICEQAEDYPYSTLNSLAGKSLPKIPIGEDTTFLSDPEGTLRWVNTAPDPERANAVKLGLRSQYFSLKKSVITGKPILDTNELI